MEIDIRTLLSHLNPECKRAMGGAAELCVKQTHFNVEVEHLLLALLDAGAPDWVLLLAHFGVDADAVRTQVQACIDGFKRGNSRTPAMSPHFVPLLREAWLTSSMLLGSQQIRSGTVLLSLLELDSLRGMLIETAPALLTIPRESLKAQLASLLAGSSEDAGPAGAAPGAPLAPAMPGSAGGGANGTPALDLYTVDMTAQARAGRIDPVRGRNAEIRQIIDILLRRRQNNPILTGEAGVGKTAVVEGFALRVAEGSVPAVLADVRVCSLDLALLQAGAGVRGEYEQRLKSVIAEVRAAATPVILFIDEAHQLIGAGGSEGQGDAANLLKPALARGELRTIAATTWAEYKKHVERDPALARRFQVVKVEEPTPEAAIGMLRGMVATLERHHQVEILDEAVRDAVRLSQRYITGRQLPDKAISVLDTACARVAIALAGTPPQLEALEYDMVQATEGLRIVRQQLGRGEGDAAEGERQAASLARMSERHAALVAKLAEERRAVEEILALRRTIAARVGGADAGGDTGAEADEHAAQAAQLQRLQKGLEAIQDEEAMVPVCVDSSMVAGVISGWTGIPVGKMLADEVHTVLQLHERLCERVVGQDQALDAIARRVRTFRAELDDPGKPVGVFMLVGPSGVGKTETACALADMLYGGERNMITINMSEFQEAHTISSLKGAPPGYVGYGKGGVLTEAVRRRPYSVVLLDEMEKAHPDVLELFFQVFDKGTMEDGEGVSIDFKHTLILLTSNAAQDVITRACQDARGKRLPDPEALVAQLRPALLRQFSPAFLGRVVLVPYYPLGDAEISVIVEMKLARLAERFAANHHARFSWDDAVTAAITARCTEVDSGARNIDYILTQTVLPQLSGLVLERIATASAFSAVHMAMGAGQQFVYGFRDSPVRGAA
ncbi:type VI secretion system ATPase TssH [Janthinobacterium sp. 1_2014MBL_MicDiv]|uniref:type VI secretion system ATPase TssH n=1 Tax=Janthinobacterium sp. 1_2014MBL_MicDiv TaxID=1644131 RepID=UPI0008F4B69F|nr:type VI secretion system ATPase TssH [Janthinobacterium sp. 1_2014MBL_MicDiv]APA68733.1 ATPase AAA [Janthinobacterium sp. 1_2014MBL_MicDiv]